MIKKNNSAKIVIISGTDTEVGKTMVSAGIARVLSNNGIHVLAIKPVESGTSQEIADHEDGVLLATATRQTHPKAALTRLREPLAPPVAADIDGVKLNFEHWYKTIRTFAEQEKTAIILVEGAGGLLSPITWKHTIADLALRLKASVLIVSADKLGSINHTLLVIESLKNANIPICGVVFSAPKIADSSTGKNASTLARWLSKKMPIAELKRVNGVQEAAKELTAVAKWLI